MARRVEAFTTSIFVPTGIALKRRMTSRERIRMQP